MMKLFRLCFVVCVTVYTCGIGVHSLTEERLNCTDDFTLQKNFTVNKDSTAIKIIFIRNITTDLCQSHCLNNTEECTGFLETEQTFGCTLIIGRFRQLSTVDSSNFYTRSCDFEHTFYVSFYSQPRAVVIELGHPVDLVCDVYGGPDAIVSIKFKSQELSTQQNYTIPNADKMDDGQYVCSVQRNQSDNDPIVKTLQLMIRYAPEFVNATGNAKSLTCNFIGLPKEVTWSKAGHVLTYSNQIVFHANGLLSDTILIDRVDSEIYGQYKCDGKNDYGHAMGHVNLKKERLNCTDDFTLQKNFTVNKDSTAIKTIFIRNITTDLCQSHCLNYTEECTGFLETEQTFGCTLIIGRFRQLSTVDSSGFYTRSCDFEQTFYVSFYSQPRAVVIELGHPVDLVCDVYGGPDAIVSIKFKNQELSTQQNYTIPNADKMDDGQYVCSVQRNQSDNDPIVKTLQLMIRYAPEFVNATGNAKSLTCNFIGLPKEVAWSKAGHVLTYSNQIVFHANGLLSDTILIDRVDSEIYGQYKCDGKNDYGHAIGHVNLTNTTSSAIGLVSSIIVRVVTGTVLALLLFVL